MSIQTPYHLLAAEAYGAGTYNSNSYDCPTGTQACATDSSTSNSAGGSLAYTGYNILIPVALAAALIIAAGIMLVSKLVRKRKTSTEA